MSDCIDPRIGRLLHAYELSILSEEEAALFEVHLLSCEHCFRELQEFEQQASLLKASDEVKESVAELTRPERAPIYTRLSIVGTAAASVILLALMLLVAPNQLVLLTQTNTGGDSRTESRESNGTRGRSGHAPQSGSNYREIAGQPAYDNTDRGSQTDDSAPVVSYSAEPNVVSLLLHTDALLSWGHLDSAWHTASAAAQLARSSRQNGDTLYLTALVRQMRIADGLRSIEVGDGLMTVILMELQSDSGIACGYRARYLLNIAEHCRRAENQAESDSRDARLAQARRYFDSASTVAENCSGVYGRDAFDIIHEQVSFYGNSLIDLCKRDSCVDRMLQTCDHAGDLDPLDSYHVYFETGYLLKMLSRYAETERYLLKATAMIDSGAGVSTLDRVATCSELGFVLEVQGKYDEADRYLSLARDLAAGSPIEKSVIYASLLKNLGNLHTAQGKYSEAEDEYRRSADIRRQHHDPNAAEALNNLGDLYSIQRRYAEAEECYKEALQLREDYYGKDHPFLFYHLHGLGKIYLAQERYQEADLVLSRCLRICRQSLGARHLNTALTEETIGDSYRARGFYSDARRQYKMALEVKRTCLGNDHWETGETLYRLGLDYESMGWHSEAMSCFRELMKSRHRFITDVFSYASEAQRLRYIDRYPVLLDPIFSLALRDSTPDARIFAMEMFTGGKSLVMDAAVADRKTVCSLNAGEEREELHTMSRICDEISRLTQTGPAGMSLRAYQQLLDSLYRSRDSAEEQISRFCSRIAEDREVRQSRLSDIVRHIPSGAVLWEYCVYRPFDFEMKGNDKRRTGPPRYLAFALDSDGDLALKDLADAEIVDSLVLLSRRILSEPDTTSCAISKLNWENRLRGVTAKLYKLVVEPLEPTVGSNGSIIVSPDGQLSLIPLEILPIAENKYAVEKYNCSYVTTARDLLDPLSAAAPSAEAIVIADPDFGRPIRSLNGNGDIGSTLRGAWPFSPLPATRAEGDSIAELLSRHGGFPVKRLYGSDARESALKDLYEAPRLLHIATHGYFCDGNNSDSLSHDRSPLVKSGLALAGANLVFEKESCFDPTAQDDGILTGLEVSNLDLFGTELVVLSACETGVGDVMNGEGVFGLRRSFRLAGAKSLLASLWTVPDKNTVELMTGFYGKWLGGSTKSAALRGTMLGLIEEQRRQFGGAAHPYYWGGFVLIGSPDPTPGATAAIR